MLFMATQIVGITDHSDVETKLEKRVVSRLNAQYVFMSKASGADVCEYIHNIFALNNHTSDAPTGSTAGGAGGGGSAVKKTSNKGEARGASPTSTEYITKFTAGMETMFGRYEPAGAEMESAALSGTASSTADEAGDPLTVTSTVEQGRRRFVPGSLHGLFCLHTDWGRDLR